MAINPWHFMCKVEDHIGSVYSELGGWILTLKAEVKSVCYSGSREIVSPEGLKLSLQACSNVN